ncbi:MAG: molybdopterin molybdotransferase MoeA [Humibacillus sp.]|nr:molybdopterin molybdotransferase MoeA [Humibacillus sp.]MDN5777548.1 molybdopterin molybdotransferase MoeA [Humibacillus sp.]
MSFEFHVSVAEHRAAITALVGGPVPGWSVLDHHALGRRLAADLVAADGLPRFDNSAMDGYAVHPADADQREFPVVGDVPAGVAPAFELERGEAARVMTGARLPLGTVAVVPVERTDASPTGPAPKQVLISQGVCAGRHVRHRGEEVSTGTTIAVDGSVVTPALIALGRSVGCARARVYSALRVAVVATGAELVDPSREPGLGSIHESNSDMVAALALSAGCIAARVLTCDDEPKRLRMLLDDLAASGEVDLVITTGGVSAGAFEVVRQVCEPLETFEFAHLAMQPGGPQGLGRWQGLPVVCLPGTPGGAFVAFQVLVRPALESRHGTPPPIARTASFQGRSRSMRAGKMQFLTSELHDDGTVTLPQGRHLAALVAANALLEVPAEVDRLVEGDVVRVHPL